MKITDLDTYLVDTQGLIKWVFVKLSTDEGIVGYGEAGSAFRERAQAAAMIPNLLAVEWPKYYYPVVPGDLRVRLVKEPLTVDKGCVRVPTAPGLGVELDEEALARYRVG